MSTALVIDRVFDASVDQLWQALTEIESIKEWYFTQVHQFEPIVGFAYVTNGI
ncbi:SRPBCC family protein [Spirosoma pulveris]